MAELTYQVRMADGDLHLAAIRHHNQFAQTGASTSIEPYKATKIELIAQEATDPNFLEFTIEYAHPLDLMLLGTAVGVLKAETALRPLLREGARPG